MASHMALLSKIALADPHEAEQVENKVNYKRWLNASVLSYH